MSNKYLEKVAYEFSVAPHSKDKNLGIHAVNLSKSEMDKYREGSNDYITGRRLATHIAIPAAALAGAAALLAPSGWRGYAATMAGMVGAGIGAHEMNRNILDAGHEAVGTDRNQSEYKEWLADLDKSASDNKYLNMEKVANTYDSATLAYLGKVDITKAKDVTPVKGMSGKGMSGKAKLLAGAAGLAGVAGLGYAATRGKKAPENKYLDKTAGVLGGVLSTAKKFAGNLTGSRVNALNGRIDKTFMSGKLPGNNLLKATSSATSAMHNTRLGVGIAGGLVAGKMIDRSGNNSQYQ